MSVDSENKSNEAIAPFTPSADQENSGNGNIGDIPITPDMVLRLPTITDNVNAVPILFSEYLCSPEANIYDIDFTRFQIRDLETGAVLFEITKPPAAECDSHQDAEADSEESTCEDANTGRFVRYQFTPQFLKLKTVGATVEFLVGPKPVNNFRMIERHFFRDRLLKTFDFQFGFCIPNSKNTCEHIYEFPTLPADLVSEMIANPFETRSDSFYFVDNQLVMHNKADYAYNGGHQNDVI
ncbi:protein unc-119 homolog isoform X1 [Vespa velutina]|uniref:protein unc-119 homolog isoform X1 n=1 Tax=Vespa velutina TaxID=202808 RepID=UPI001FB3C0E9|nr:protein unc-119 homolog isoform X1 [Vespa velutina]XP_047349093.1 protein unc-119 homolog isoform X1 [Vespa velutina]XP_047349094.1 protein unc-119 homolog isoform X1 [Vespa velutina]XP_047349095.1 protein unc-119 homolog isoform X1 [Vespa velutina]